MKYALSRSSNPIRRVSFSETVDAVSVPFVEQTVAKFNLSHICALVGYLLRLITFGRDLHKVGLSTSHPNDLPVLDGVVISKRALQINFTVDMLAELYQKP